MNHNKRTKKTNGEKKTDRTEGMRSRTLSFQVRGGKREGVDKVGFILWGWEQEAEVFPSNSVHISNKIGDYLLRV